MTYPSISDVGGGGRLLKGAELQSWTSAGRAAAAEMSDETRTDGRRTIGASAYKQNESRHI